MVPRIATSVAHQALPLGGRGRTSRAATSPPVRPDREGRDDVGEERQAPATSGSTRSGIAQADGGPRDARGRTATTNTCEVQPVRISAASAMPARSAAMLIVFAKRRAAAKRIEEPPRKLLAHRAGQPLSGDHADARAHHLDGRHQRPGQSRGPQKRGAELGARDRVGRDTRRIVVGRARDDPGPQGVPETAERALARAARARGVRAAAHAVGSARARGPPVGSRRVNTAPPPGRSETSTVPP